MISKYTYKKLTWIDVESPTKDEILHLSEEYAIPPLVGEEVLSESIHSKVDLYSNLIYLVLQFPTINKKDDIGKEQEVDFIIGKNFLITVHYELIDPLHEFSKVFEANSILDRENMGEHAGFLFYYIVKEMYKRSVNELEDIGALLKIIEGNIFGGNEGKMVREISNVNRKLLDFKQALRFHSHILKSFENAGTRLFGGDFSYYLSDISSEYSKVSSVLENHREVLTDMRNTNDSLLTNQTDATIRVLTIITFLISPVTVISSIFMMNTDFVLIHGMFDFYLVLGAMLLTSIAAFIYFRMKKWL